MRSSVVTVTRDVRSEEEGNFAGRDVSEGEILFVFYGVTYGCVDDSVGIALSEAGPLEGPFFEFPISALSFEEKKS